MSYRTEEEQIAIFAQWWKENGQSLVIGVALSLAAFFAWNGWQKNQLQENESASVEYEILLNLSSESDASLNAVREKADSIKAEYSNTFYADAASLLLAKQAADESDWLTAQAELEALLARRPDDALEYTARLRLAKIYYNNEDYDAGLKQLREPIPSSYKIAFYETKGDILRDKGDIEKAAEAYKEAQTQAEESNTTSGDGIKQKLNSLMLVE